MPVAQDVPDWTLPISTVQLVGNVTDSFAALVASAAGASTLVAAVAGKIIVVRSLVLIASAAVNAKFQDHTAPTDLTGLYYLAANGGVVLPYNATGWFQSQLGHALDINLSGAIPVGGHVVYGLVG